MKKDRKKIERIYFEGTYYKHQANGNTLAIIPGRASNCAFIQVITDDQSHYVEYPLSAYRQQGECLVVGNSEFSSQGIHLNIKTSEMSVIGDLSYGSLTPLKSDIMGPFRYLPMQCRHGVISMQHALTGSVMDCQHLFRQLF